MTPFKAPYGYAPPQLSLGSQPRSQVESVNSILRDQQATLTQLKANLIRALARLKQYKEKHRSERKLEVDYWVYLKLQPYRQVMAVRLRNQKLSSKYYGLFEVIQKISMVAYRLNLPPSSTIHLVFHISQLKKKVESNQSINPVLPVLGPGVFMQPRPQLILARRMIKRWNAVTSQVLVKWHNQSKDDAI